MYFSRIILKPEIAQSSNLHHLMQGNGYGVHQLLWELFPGQKQRPFLFREEIAGEQLRHRPDIKGEPIYYLVSREAPLRDTALFVTEGKPYLPQLKSGDLLAFKLRANPIVSRKKAGKKNSVKHDVVMDAQRNLLMELGKDLKVVCEDKKSILEQKILAAWQRSRNETVTTKLHSIIGENERSAAHKPERMLSGAMKACADQALERWLMGKAEKNGFQIHRKDGGILHLQAESYRWHALPGKGRSAGFSSIDFEGVLEVRDPAMFVDALYNGIGPAKGFGCGLMLVRRA